MTEKLIIPKVTAPGITLDKVRKAGELADIATANARNNASSTNPYIRGVSTNPTNATADDFIKYKSDLGSKVYADVTFDTITYTDNNNNSISTPKMTFQAILVSVVFPRNIVKTEIQGRNGTVKEYIGEGDASVTFSGVITGGNGIYPEKIISDFMKVIKAPVAIPVICTHLQNLGIYNVVFDERTFEQEEGSYSYQSFSVNSVSDTPQELLITGM
ncbi:MAG TPA: DUF6046 domain-containing protein [Hanamia sp.]|nr:DUF6046 domain-containing protein [Hanamia sp.]